MALGAKLNVTFQRRFLAFCNPLDPHNGNPFGLIYFSDFLEFVDTLYIMCLIIFEEKAEIQDQYPLSLNLVQKADDPIQDRNISSGPLCFILTFRDPVTL